MSGIYAAIAPVFALIVVGWGVRASGLIPRSAWLGVNAVAYWVCFPALLFTTIARADMSAVDAPPFFAAAACACVAMACLLLSLKPALRGVPGPSYASVVQAGVRWNGMILLAGVGALYGPTGVALAALVFAPIVPLVNLISVSALSIWGDGAHPTPGRFARRLATNPLILAALAGLAANVAGIAPFGVIDDTLTLVAAAALPVGLMGVGAGLDLRSVANQRLLLALCLALKLVVMPALMLVCARLFGLDPIATAILVAAGATPGAAASYVLARELGGDAPLTAGHVTATTLASTVTMPVWLLTVAPPT